eukprot:CAMPEP_0197032038 /NCGR_PEP_ID=MMETSP1384-20130603/10816_1 /TAXON_ID=29189 /ORGANISM="Ammonia sp." /LENGTH=142 /DNA_ID=CAMNT_0042461633 /DNA_START=98 /DNA_END=522 /DNA_ORIENTATION=+
MDNRCRNIISENPVLRHDHLTPTVLSKFVPHIYKPKEIIGRFKAIGSYIEPYRTLYIDQLLKSFVFDQPQNSNTDNNQQACTYHVIELGVGFDFRMERILNFMQTTEQSIRATDLFLYELDLPNVLDVRECLMTELGGVDSG